MTYDPNTTEMQELHHTLFERKYKDCLVNSSGCVSRIFEALGLVEVWEKVYYGERVDQYRWVSFRRQQRDALEKLIDGLKRTVTLNILENLECSRVVNNFPQLLRRMKNQ